MASLIEDIRLREARQLRDYDAEEFRRHRGGCDTCGTSRGGTGPGGLCPAGLKLWASRQSTHRAWESERDDAQAAAERTQLSLF